MKIADRDVVGLQGIVSRVFVEVMPAVDLLRAIRPPKDPMAEEHQAVAAHILPTLLQWCTECVACVPFLSWPSLLTHPH